MAYKKENLANMSVVSRTGVTPCVYSYYNQDGDSLTVLEGENFLQNMRLTAKDQIHVISADGTKTSVFHITAVAPGGFATMAKSTAITA
jgi:hypothetical protein